MSEKDEIAYASFQPRVCWEKKGNQNRVGSNTIKKGSSRLQLISSATMVESSGVMFGETTKLDRKF